MRSIAICAISHRHLRLPPPRRASGRPLPPGAVRQRAPGRASEVAGISCRKQLMENSNSPGIYGNFYMKTLGDYVSVWCVSFCLTCSALNRGHHLLSASWYTRCPAHSFYGFSSQTLLLSLVASLQPPEKPNFNEFNTTRSSTSSCLVTVTASDLKNSYNLSFINQDSAARSSRISCKIAWVDLFRWGEQLLKHRSIPWLSMVPAAASLSETWRDFVVHHFQPGQGKLQQHGYGGERQSCQCVNIMWITSIR